MTLLCSETFLKVVVGMFVIFFVSEFFLKEVVSIESVEKNKKCHKARKKTSCRWRRVSLAGFFFVMSE